MRAAPGRANSGRGRSHPAAVIACVVLLVCDLALLPLAARGASPATPEADSDVRMSELETFKTWLQTSHPGYGCDEGPAPFGNAAVQAAYPERRFYYVLTHARGIAPPFKNALSLVADIGPDGTVRRLDASSLDTYRLGLMKASKPAEARRAAAAVLILALGDPGAKRWPINESLFLVRKDQGGWACMYYHDTYHASEVKFDKRGVLSSFNCSPPPVP